jgi:hypothetical protein
MAAHQRAPRPLVQGIDAQQPSCVLDRLPVSVFMALPAPCNRLAQRIGLILSVFTDLSTAVERSESASSHEPIEWGERSPTSVSGAASRHLACTQIDEEPTFTGNLGLDQRWPATAVCDEEVNREHSAD